MWKLEKISSAKEQEYLKLILDQVLAKLANTCPSVKKIIDKEYVEKLLLALPDELIKIEGDFNKRCKDQQSVKRIFKYPLLSGDKGFKLAQIIGKNTCVYCNRSYTTTVSNAKKGVVRPQFDHWYDKGYHPLLALSLYNLIPCCSLCNGTWLKGSNHFDQSNHVHPYHMNDDETFVFRYIRCEKHKFMVDIETSSKKVENTLEIFKTREIYNSHSNFELRDMINLRHIYSKNYIEELAKRLRHTITIDEIYSSLLGFDNNPNNDLDRPLSKFRRDIFNQLNENNKRIIKKHP